MFRKILLRLLITLGSIILFYCFLFFIILLPLLHKENFQNYIKQTVNERILAPQNLAFDYTTLSTQIYPFRITFNGFSLKRIVEKEEVPDLVFESAHINARVSFSRLLYGRLLIKHMALNKPRLFMKIAPPKDPKQRAKRGIPDLFTILQDASHLIRQLSIREGELQIEHPDQKIRIANLSVGGMLSWGKLRANLELRDLSSHGKFGEYDITALRTTITFDGRTARFQQLLLDHQEIKIALEDGTIKTNGDYRFKQIAISFNQDFIPVIQANRFFKFPKSLPRITGKFHISGDLLGKIGDSPQGTFLLSANKLSIHGRKVGQLNLPIEIQQDHLSITEGLVKGHFGPLKLEAISISLKNPYPIEGVIQTTGTHFSQLLHLAGITGCKSFYDMYGPINFSGALSPLSIQGSINFNIKDFFVTPSINKVNKPDEHVLRLKTVKLEGGFEILKDKTHFKAMRVSSGGSNIFVNGFIQHQPIDVHLDVETDSFNLDVLRYISKVKVSGTGPIQGHIHVDDKGLFIDATTTLEEGHVGPYHLGHVSTEIHYKENIINFTETLIEEEETLIKGTVSLNLMNPFTLGVNANVQQATSEYVKTFLGPDHDYYLKYLQDGRFYGVVSLAGEPAPSKLSGVYNINGANVRYYHEDFNEVHAKANFRNAFMHFEEAWFKKGESKINLEGKLGKGAQYDLKFSSNPIPLSTLNIFSENRIATAGHLFLTGDLKGPFDKPQLNITLNIPTSELHGKPLPRNINTELSYHDQTWTFDMHQAVKHWIDFDLNTKGKQAFSLILDLENFPFMIPLGFKFPHMLSTPLLGNITLAGQIKGEAKRLSKSLSGALQLNKLWIGEGARFIALNNPMNLKLKPLNKPLSFDFNFLDSEENALLMNYILNPDFSFKVSAQGKLESHFVNLITEIVDSMDGVFSGDISLSRKSKKWFVHSKQGIDSESLGLRFPFMPEKVTFSPFRVNFAKPNVISFKDLVGTFHTGQTTLNGSVGLNEQTLHPMPNMHFVMNNTTLTIPECFRSTGDSDLKLVGNQPPYLLSGKINILSGGNICPIKQVAEKALSFESILVAEKIPEPQITFDLLITSEPESFAARYEFFNSLVGGSLTLKDTPVDFKLGGDISSRSGELKFRNHVFQIDKFQLAFEPQDLFKSRVYLKAFSQIQNYDVNLLVTGLLDKYDFEFSTVPALPKRDVLSLILFGTVSTQLNQSDQTELLQYEVGGSLIQKVPLTESVEKQTGLSFQLTSEYGSEGETSQGQLSIKRDMTDRIEAELNQGIGEEATSKITLGYDISRKVKLRASLEDISNMDKVTTINQSFGLDVLIKSEFD